MSTQALPVGNPPVEIKFNIAGDPAVALATLNAGAGAQRTVWFLEDLTPGLPPLPLFTHHIVVRLRRDADGTGDSTVKLRPCRRSQLTGPWAEPQTRRHLKYRIEGDWAAARHTLAASCVAELSASALSAAVGPYPAVTGVFVKQQRDLVKRCADVAVSLDALTPLGPIDAVKWEGIVIDQWEVTAERWTVGTLDFLELSVRAAAEDAPELQRTLTAAIIAQGLSLDLATAPKTEQVLRYLHDRAVATPVG